MAHQGVRPEAAGDMHGRGDGQPHVRGEGRPLHRGRAHGQGGPQDPEGGPCRTLQASRRLHRGHSLSPGPDARQGPHRKARLMRLDSREREPRDPVGERRREELCGAGIGQCRLQEAPHGALRATERHVPGAEHREVRRGPVRCDRRLLRSQAPHTGRLPHHADRGRKECNRPVRDTRAPRVIDIKGPDMRQYMASKKAEEQEGYWE